MTVSERGGREGALCTKQVVGSCDGVNITSQVEVELH